MKGNSPYKSNANDNNLFQVVEVLVKHGANVNCVSDTGSTPVRSACFMTHLEIVQLLVQFSADIQRSVYNFS